MSEERLPINTRTEERAPNLEGEMHPSTTDKPVSPQVIFDFLSSDIDLGGIEPPLEHVSLSDVHKKTRNGLAVQQGQSENNQLTGFISINDVDQPVFRCPTAPVGEAPNEAAIAGLDGDDSATAVADTPSTGQDSQVADTDEGAAQAAILTPGMYSNVPPEESDEQSEKRAYEEDQKRKWEGIDQWIYDEFHDYVELI